MVTLFETCYLGASFLCEFFIILFSFHVFSPGLVPIIRCPRGTAAEMVGEKLDKKLRENLRDTRNSLFTGSEMMQAGQIRSDDNAAIMPSDFVSIS